MTKKSRLSGSLMLLLCSFIWGTTFVLQSDAMANVGPFTFSALRSAIGALALTVFLLLTQKKELFLAFSKEKIKNTLVCGVVCGVVLFVSINFQQVALVKAAPGKAAFITALYIVIVPLLGVFLKKKVALNAWISVAVAVVGFYFLNINPEEGFGLTVWELLTLFCAITFSVHILCVDNFVRDVSPVLLSCIQFWTVAILSALCIGVDVSLLSYSLPDGAVFGKIWFNILYAGLFSSGIAYTLQIAGQKRLPAPIASLLMSLESVFAVIAAWVVNPENALTPVQVLGCVLIMIAVSLPPVVDFLHDRRSVS